MTIVSRHLLDLIDAVLLDGGNPHEPRSTPPLIELTGLERRQLVLARKAIVNGLGGETHKRFLLDQVLFLAVRIHQRGKADGT